MNTMFFLSSASQMIQKDPGITKVITQFLGFFLDHIFNFVTNFVQANSLGISIILFTILVRVMMLPLAVKQQKSMVKMQLIQPEVQKINEKYADSKKDPEVQRKIQQETQALYQKHGVSLFGGCLPLFIQMPIFFALSYMMNNAYLFISKLGILYENLAVTITQIPNWDLTLATIASPKTVASKVVLDFNYISDIQKVLNKFSSSDWTLMLSNASQDVINSVNTQIENLISVEFFFGIDLTTACGWLFPGILIPIGCAVATAISSYTMQAKNTTQTEQAKQTQKITMIIMPIFIGFTTVGFSAGVGLYWITSNIFQIFQQLIINKRVITKASHTTIEIVEEKEHKKHNNSKKNK